MQEILCNVSIWNPLDEMRIVHGVGHVDTGSRFPILPMQWKDRLGPLSASRPHSLETADRRVVQGEICGPVMFKVNGFPVVGTEVLFLPMTGDDHQDFAVVGHLVLQQAGIIVDLVTHRLFKRSDVEAV